MCDMCEIYEFDEKYWNLIEWFQIFETLFFYYDQKLVSCWYLDKVIMT